MRVWCLRRSAERVQPQTGQAPRGVEEVPGLFGRSRQGYTVGTEQFVNELSTIGERFEASQKFRW